MRACRPQRYASLERALSIHGTHSIMLDKPVVAPVVAPRANDMIDFFLLVFLHLKTQSRRFGHRTRVSRAAWTSMLKHLSALPLLYREVRTGILVAARTDGSGLALLDEYAGYAVCLRPPFRAVGAAAACQCQTGLRAHTS